MKDDQRTPRPSGSRPIVVHPGPLSIDELLRFVDPAPDAETEQFVATIYEDRRAAVEPSTSR